MSSTCPWYSTIRRRSLRAAPVISLRSKFKARVFRSAVKRTDSGCRPAGRWLCSHVAHWIKHKSTPATKRHFNLLLSPTQMTAKSFSLKPPTFFHPSLLLLLAHLLLAFYRFTRRMANRPLALRLCGCMKRLINVLPHFATRFICPAHFQRMNRTGPAMKQVSQGSAPAPRVQREAATDNGWIIQKTHQSTSGPLPGWLLHSRLHQRWGSSVR